MSTPIEIVREMQLWRRAQGKYGLDDYPPGMPFSPREYGEALDAVLRDAERFEVIREAHENGGPVNIQTFFPSLDRYLTWTGTLAELADRLRKEAP